MKIFAIYATPILTEKPEWFDDFYRSYGGGYDLHITLKQSCFIAEKDGQAVRDILSNFSNALRIPDHKIDVVLDTIVIPEDGCIMITAQKNEILNELQKNILSALKEYSQYTTPELEAYEKNFIPHITIAEDVSLVKEDLSTLKSNCFFKGELRDVTLSIVNEITPEEARDPKNKTVYRF